MNQRMLIEDVRDQYAGVARSELSNDSSSVRSIASAFGCSEDELNQLPSEANSGQQRPTAANSSCCGTSGCC